MFYSLKLDINMCKYKLDLEQARIFLVMSFNAIKYKYYLF